MEGETVRWAYMSSTVVLQTCFLLLFFKKDKRLKNCMGVKWSQCSKKMEILLLSNKWVNTVHIIFQFPAAEKEAVIWRTEAYIQEWQSISVWIHQDNYLYVGCTMWHCTVDRELTFIAMLYHQPSFILFQNQVLILKYAVPAHTHTR